MYDNNIYIKRQQVRDFIFIIVIIIIIIVVVIIVIIIIIIIVYSGLRSGKWMCINEEGETKCV